MVVHNPSQDILNEPILIPPTSIIRPSTHSRWDPASPEALSRLLSTISPRGSRSPSPEPSFDNDTELDSLSPPTDGSSGTDYSEVRSPPALGLLGDTVASESNRAEPHEPLTATLSALDIDVSLGVGMSMDSVNGDVGKNEDDYALKEGLRGLYNLWKVVRGSKGVSAKESDKDAFLRIVEEVVA